MSKKTKIVNKLINLEFSISQRMRKRAQKELNTRSEVLLLSDFIDGKHIYHCNNHLDTNDRDEESKVSPAESDAEDEQHIVHMKMSYYKMDSDELQNQI
jgi:hypothetical protein